MINDKLDSSFSPAGQKSYNQRLKTLEGKVDGLKSNVTTEEIKATAAEIEKLKVTESLEISGTLQVEDAEINQITSESITSTEVSASSVESNSVETKALAAENAEIEDLKTKTLETETLEANEANLKDVTIETLTVKELIEELNVKLLKISDKATLQELTGILQVAQEWNKLQIQTEERPQWKELKLVTEEMLNSPFKLQGVVNERTDLPDLPTDPDPSLEGDTYLVRNDGEPFMAVVVEGAWVEIPYPVLQMYRTADDQNVIDNELQKRIDSTELDLTETNKTVEANKQEFDEHVVAQNDINKETTSKFVDIDKHFEANEEAIDKKLSDAPIDDQLYGRRNGIWQNIVTEGAYVPKHYDKVEKYFSDITLEKDPAYLETSQLVTIETLLDDGNTKTTQYFLALWHLKPSEADNFAYTTKNAFDFINQYKDKVNEPVYNAIMEAYNANRVIGKSNKNEYQTLDWLDVEQPFGTEKEGDTVERPDGEVLGTNDITSDDNGVDINSSIGFTANTPTTTSDERSVINRKYIKDNLKLSMSASESGASSAVLTYGKTIIDNVLDRATAYQPNAVYNEPWLMTFSPWMHRTKDYVYYKVDNAENQSASSFSFWFSLDKDGNVINMTNPREDRGNATAGESDCEEWMTYHPDNWNGVNDNYAYWPHVSPDYGGYITIFNNGRFAGYVEDENGNSNNLYTVTGLSQSTRPVGGKSLRGDKTRMFVVNTSSTAAQALKAGIIGVDANNEEGLNKFRPVALPSAITWGHRGVAAGKQHFFAQAARTNTFMVISASGAVASYVMTDPTTQEALTATNIYNGHRNFIELENGDCIFFVRDETAKQCYFIYCNDNFEEEGIDPFTVYRCGTDYTSGKWPLCVGNPFIEFGNFVYFFPTGGQEVEGSWANGTITLYQTYSRFNKTTKSWSDSLLNWSYNSADGAGIRALKTHDPFEDKDYLWVFQAQQAPSTTSPIQAQCLVIAENGTSQYVDLGTGSSIHWFDNEAKSGETLVSSYTYPLNPSGTAQWSYRCTQRPVVPLVAVTEEGIGMLMSNSCRDVCIFYGNGHFAIYSYDTPQEGGPWSYFSPQTGHGPGFIGGKYGWKLYVTFNNSLNVLGGETASSQATIYIKPTGEDYLGEPVYFWKPLGYGMDRQYWCMNDGMDYMETDFSNYKKGKGKVLSSIRPAMGGWYPRRGMTNWETETTTNSSTLYLRDGNDVLSQVNIK